MRFTYTGRGRVVITIVVGCRIYTITRYLIGCLADTSRYLQGIAMRDTSLILLNSFLLRGGYGLSYHT